MTPGTNEALTVVRPDEGMPYIEINPKKVDAIQGLTAADVFLVARNCGAFEDNSDDEAGDDSVRIRVIGDDSTIRNAELDEVNRIIENLQYPQFSGE